MLSRYPACPDRVLPNDAACLREEPIMFRNALSLVLVLFLGLFSVPAARAAYVFPVPEDGSFFRFLLLEPGEPFADYPDDETSAFELDEDELDSLQTGAEYWRGILQPGAGNAGPLTIEVLTRDRYDDNASASSNPLRQGPYAGMFELSAALRGNWFGEDGQGFDETLAWVTIDHGRPPSGEWYLGPMASLPQNGDMSDLASTVLHELGHALGIGAFSHHEGADGNFYFGDQLDNWTRGLRDMYGKSARPGMPIVTHGNPDPDSFVMEAPDDRAFCFNGAYFTGRHVQEVLNGAQLYFPSDGLRHEYTRPVPGLPVNGMELVPELSHIELRNSLMSHQDYRNWNTLMEAELAVFQDLGLKLDRRNFYGFSIYHDGLTLVNSNPYFARNATGDGWLDGRPNTSPWGTGLHIYGSGNTITQAADLLADGFYALGVRVDGWNNALTIAPGTRIQANGEGGTGLLVSYGKEQSLNVRGSVTATGEEGIAVRLDFGDNEMGNRTEYRGSYMRSRGQYRDGHWEFKPQYSLLPELQGPLLTSLDLTGTLTGSRAAIYISENALVQNINIMSGAQISGDIISRWDPDHPYIQYSGDPSALYTSLSFGLKPGSDGKATAVADPAFDMTLNGGVYGPESLAMRVEGGRLAVNGPLEVFSLANNAHLALYRIAEEGRGALVNDAFTNAAGATLETGFNAAGQVAGVEAESATVQGSWKLTPLQDYYDGSNIIPEAAVRLADGSPAPVFDSVTLGENPSPTLRYKLMGAASDPLIAVSRAADAYSRHADNPGAAGTGQALAQIAGQARGDMQNLLAALDFSGKDGNGVRSGTARLSPEAYDAASRASLQRQQQLSSQILMGQWERAYTQASATSSASPSASVTGMSAGDALPANRQAWVMPFGSYTRQKDSGGVSGWHSYALGTLAGLDFRLESGLSYGLHLAAVMQETSVRGHHNAELRSHGFYLGGHALHSPETWEGFYLTGQARLGVENNEMKRDIAINGYERRTTSEWTGLVGAALLGAGRDWRWDGFHAGPLAWLEYGFTHRPGVTEEGGAAANLRLEDRSFHSLSLALGAHAGMVTPLTEELDLQAGLMAAWKHELLDDPFRSPAAFRDYGFAGFESVTGLADRDALLLQASLRLNHADAIHAQLDLGGELRESGQGINISLRFGWEF